MDTIGSLIDKLSVVNIKIFHLVDAIEDKNADDIAVAAAARKAQALNRERSSLINEINENLGVKDRVIKL